MVKLNVLRKIINDAHVFQIDDMVKLFAKCVEKDNKIHMWSHPLITFWISH